MSVKGQKQLSKAHDNIYWYSKSDKWTFNVDAIRQPYSEASLARKGYKLNKIGSKGTAKEGITVLNEIGKFPEDWYTIPYLRGKERIGYPTQKPLALLERIIKASSNEGDVVLDPFMGGGTTMVMSKMLGRKFIGIDQSVAAVDVTNNRLNIASGIFKHHEIDKFYYAEEDLKDMPHFEFERFIIEKFGGKANTKQTGDGGIDGYKDGVPIQVKRWKNKVGRDEVQKFLGACHSNRLYDERISARLPVGYFIAFDFSKDAIGELARLQMDNKIIIERVLVSDIVPVAKKPVVSIVREETADGKYKFIATSDTPIINFSWDFEYGVPSHKHPGEKAAFNPTVLYDKPIDDARLVGSRIHNFASSGSHNIAVKVVDDKCLENIAVFSFSI